jgi:photosystem II stability/assembly factor-like uncharacterized protein
VLRRYSANLGGQILEVPFSAPTASHWAVFLGPRPYVTADGGRSWSTLIPSPRFRAPQVGSLDFVTTRDGWVTGQPPGKPNEYGFYYTTDGGRTWEPL